MDSPLDIALRFSTTDGAEIDIDSLKITYGYFLRTNITERILEHAVLDGKFVLARGAELPSGKHEIFVSISDNQGRETEEEFKVVIR